MFKQRKKTLDKLFIIFSIVGVFLLFFIIRGINYYIDSFLFREFNGQSESLKISNKINKENSDPYITKNNDIEDEFLTKPVISDDSPSFGSSDAKLTIVEFSDLTCGFCRKQEEIIKKVINKYNGDIRLIWKYYPNSFGPSLKVSSAAYCAYEQDKFWEFQSLFFKRSKGIIDDRLLLDTASKIGLNEKKFKNCLNDEKSFNRIMDDIKEANALRIPGVPFYFIGSQEILGEINEKELENIIETELSKLTNE